MFPRPSSGRDLACPRRLGDRRQRPSALASRAFRDGRRHHRRRLRGRRRPPFEITTHLIDVLGDDGFLLLPTSPGPAPLKAPARASWTLFAPPPWNCCPAGLAGAQVSLPAGTVDGAPVGLSLIGPPGGDGQLWRWPRL